MSVLLLTSRPEVSLPTLPAGAAAASVLLAGGITAATTAPVSAASPTPAPAPQARTTTSGQDARVVTLLTGDRVFVNPGPNGVPTVTIEPRAGRPGPGGF